MNATCRSCGAAGLQSILDLGRTPLANALLNAEELDAPEPAYPLELAFCPHCTLVQILETVSPEKLFRDYVYFSSFADTTLSHARTLANRMIESRRLNQDSLVIEAASNDGYLLQYYLQAGVPVLGIEPAFNIAHVAREQRGIDTRCDFFTEGLAQSLIAEGRRADVFHAHNVLAHVADLNGFVRGIRTVLKSDGVAVIEVPYVGDLIEHAEFDTIYHEHLCYFSLTALQNLFQRHELNLRDVERIGIHGGSIRLHVGRRATNLPASMRVQDLLREETRKGIDCAAFYQTFGLRVRALKTALCGFLADLKRKGLRIAAYGASAKGSTLLNYFGIGPETLDFVVDRSPIKQGRFTPGTHLPIFAPDKLVETVPDYVLLLTWNFADEIMGQQAEYRRRGGRFICPLPEVKVA